MAPTGSRHNPDLGSLALLSVLSTFLPKIPHVVLIFLTKPFPVNLLTKEGRLPVPSSEDTLPQHCQTRQKHSRGISGRSGKLCDSKEGGARPPPVGGSTTSNSMRPARGAGCSPRVEGLGLILELLSSRSGARSRGLPGQAGQGLQGLLVLLQLRPETRVGLGHRAGALHRLRRRGRG